MTPASRGKTWWGLGLVLVLVILAGLYFSGLVPLPFGQPKPKALCYVSPKNPNFIKRPRAKTPKAMNWCRSTPPRPRASPPHGPGGGPHRQAGSARPSIGTAPCIRKSSGTPPANAPSAAWTWCRSSRGAPAPRPRLPAPAARKSARSSTGCRPWTPATSGTSPARPPAAWTWCRSMRRRGRRPRAPSRCHPPPSSPWGCEPPRWRSGPCPGSPWPWAW